jgi:hypothetical protein
VHNQSLRKINPAVLYDSTELALPTQVLAYAVADGYIYLGGKARAGHLGNAAIYKIDPTMLTYEIYFEDVGIDYITALVTDGSFLYYGCNDGRIGKVKLADMSSVQSYYVYATKIEALAYLHGYLLASNSSGTALLKRIKTKLPLEDDAYVTLPASDYYVRCLITEPGTCLYWKC